MKKLLLFSILFSFSFAHALAITNENVELLFFANQLDSLQSVLENEAKESPATLYGRGLLAIVDKRYKDAEELLKKAIKKDESVSNYHLWFARTVGSRAIETNLLRKAGFAKKARKAWEKAVELNPENLDAREDLINFCMNAPGFLGGGRDKAETQAAEIKKRDLKRGIRAWAKLYTMAEESDNAQLEYETLVATFPADSIARLELGFFYQNQKQYAQAFDTFQLLRARHPNYTSAIYQIGRTAIFADSLVDTGIASMQDYLALPHAPGTPNHAWAFYRLGCLYELKEDFENAVDAYKKALALEEEEDQFKKSLKRVTKKIDR